MTMLITICIGIVFATLLGGAFALRLRDHLHVVLGFSAGAVVGVAFFDLIPESIELAAANYGPDFMLGITALGFVIYLALDRWILLHSHNHAHEEEHEPSRGIFGAGSIALHSLFDGIGIGLAFQVSPEVGAIVAAAVVAHRFSDGVNTVGLILRAGGDRIRAIQWLLITSLAPVLGIAATQFFSVPDVVLGQVLALFAGFFLYIGASDLIPESHHAHPVRWTTFATILGIAAMYLIVHLAH